jgi:hypothetical protein
MTVQSAQWTDNTRTMILATIDHVEGMYVPDDPANRYRQQVAAWEAGPPPHTIADPPPPPDPFGGENARAAQKRKMEKAADAGDFKTAFSILTELTGV